MIRMAFETILRHLWLLRSRGRMETNRDVHLLCFLPERIETTVMNLPAVDRLRAERQANGTVFYRPLNLFDCEIDIMQSDQGRALQAFAIRFAKIRHPIVPRLV